jgi:uncharacterized protein YbaR (Trm112 family)
MDNKLLAMLVCPVCKSTLQYHNPAKQPAGLICQPCHVMYPIRDGVPVMLEDEAIKLD